MRALLRSFMRTRGGCELDAGDLYFMLDGGSQNGTQSYRHKIVNCFVDEAGSIIKEKSEKHIHVTLDEDSLIARKGCVRGINAIDQVELLTISFCPGSLDDIL